MNTPLDESLHSFLIRHQLAYMHKFDPKGVISIDGRWRNEPFAHQDTHIFYKFDDLFLLEAIDVGTLLSGTHHQFFDVPHAYCRSLKPTFFKENMTKGKSKGGLPITFCPVCIKGMIRGRGYAYFRKSWEYDGKCEFHNTPLSCLTTTDYKSTVKAVKRLLTGKNVPSDEIVRVGIRNFTESERVNLFYPIKTVACVGKELGICLARHMGELLSSKWLPLDVKDMINLTHTLISSPIDSREYKHGCKLLGQIMVLLQNFKPLADYLNHNCSYVKMLGGARNQLAEIVLVPKKKACDSCSDLFCKKRIKKSHYIKHLDADYLAETSTPLKRLGYQQNILQSTGKYLWSPIIIGDSMFNNLSKGNKD